MTKQNECEHKKAVVSFAKADAASEELNAHLRACADCRETEKIVRFFQTANQAETAAPKLPTAGFVWWKARILNKRRAAARASQPLFIWQISAVIVGVLFCFWLIWTIPALNRAADQLVGSVERILPFLIGGILSFALLSLASVFLLRRFLADK